MSTQHEIGEDQEASSQAPGSLSPQDTLPEQKIYPAQTFPQPQLVKATRSVYSSKPSGKSPSYSSQTASTERGRRTG